MPRGDGTGPTGMGQITGRAAGYCAGFGMPGFANAVPGRGYGGGGRGWRHWFYATGRPGWMRFGGGASPYAYAATYQRPEPDVGKQALKNQAEALQSELDFIKERLSDVEAGSAAE